MLTLSLVRDAAFIKAAKKIEQGWSSYTRPLDEEFPISDVESKLAKTQVEKLEDLEDTTLRRSGIMVNTWSQDKFVKTVLPKYAAKKETKASEVDAAPMDFCQQFARFLHLLQTKTLTKSFTVQLSPHHKYC